MDSSVVGVAFFEEPGLHLPEGNKFINKRKENISIFLKIISLLYEVEKRNFQEHRASMYHQKENLISYAHRLFRI